MANNEQNFQILQTQRKGILVAQDGYYYKKNKQRGLKAYFVCQNSECKLTTTANLDPQGNIIVFQPKVGEHSHPRDFAKANDLKYREIIKKAAAVEGAIPSRIIRNAINQTNNTQSTQQQLNDVLKRERTKEAPPEPKSLNEISLNADQQLTLDGELFLEYDSSDRRDAANKRVQLFITYSNAVILARSPIFLCDGTFKCVLRLFQQLYTLHGMVKVVDNTKILPLAYMLMQQKDKESYVDTFNALKQCFENNNLEVNAQYMLLDFEMAAILGFKQVFPDIEVRCCSFHLANSVFKKVKQLGLQREYMQNQDFRDNIKLLPAMSFLQPNEIKIVFQYLQNQVFQDEIYDDIIQYFDENYVNGKLTRRNTRNPPIFPPEIWSTVQVYLDLHIRTTNHCEGFHSKWNRFLNQAQPSYWDFLSELKQNVKSVDLEVLSMQQISYKIKKTRKEQKRQEMVEKFIDEFVFDDDMLFFAYEFLQKISRVGIHDSNESQ